MNLVQYGLRNFGRYQSIERIIPADLKYVWKKTNKQTQINRLVNKTAWWLGGGVCSVIFVAIARSQAVKDYDPNWHHLSTLAPKQEINKLKFCNLVVYSLLTVFIFILRM
jgi:hypothetical protein